MTEERKQYLASISKEERVIRLAIAEEKSFIGMCKDHLNCGCRTKTTYKMIATTKAKIKSLKKQLPAPTTEVEHEHLYSYQCPICKAGIVYFPCYCPDCGQKLR